MPRKAFTHPSENQSTLTFDGAESESSLSVITPISYPSPLSKRDEIILTVSELDSRIKSVIDCEVLTDITVTGEITGFRINSSGHYYFSLTEKGESESSIPCIIWRSRSRKISFEMKNGLAINVTGYVDFYPPSGRLQFIAKKVELALEGKGGLYLQ
ncbi:MAG TPA: exodeoxyribonuclease VII large subunit, partial [Methanocorpusculum sp.]|nr:exodeoxyribonuclease VII large subunit [Methanocorpusculum sp.]